MTAARDPLALWQPRPDINARRVVRQAARIARVRSLTHDTVELVVACSSGVHPLMARAGQFAALTFTDLGVTRAYSFARDPAAEAAGEYTFSIRLVPDGAVSAWLAAGDRRGAALEVAGPLGRFVLDDSPRPMLLVAGGSGLSAIKALAEEAARRGLARDCLLLHGARTRADLHGEAELAAVAAAWHPAHAFRFEQVLSDEPAASPWTGPRGLVTAWLDAELQRRGPAAADACAWLCGPPPMIEAGARVLHARGLPASRILRDVFTDHRSPAPLIDNLRCVLCDECLLVRPVADCIVEADIRGPHVRPRRLVPVENPGLYYQSLAIDDARCLRCYACVNACPHDAIRLPA